MFRRLFIQVGITSLFRNQENDPAEIMEILQDNEGRNGIAEWNVDNLPTVVYFYKLRTENYNEVKKMLLIQQFPVKVEGNKTLLT